MGSNYVRQSETAIATGEVIQASHSEDEYDQLVLAFTADSGHSHDGTTGEGGDVTKLLGTAITIGDGTAGTDIAVTFDGESNDGLLTWMEDEDQFKFSDDVMLIDNEALILGSDSDITIKYDETTNDALEIAANVEGAPLAIILKADQGDDAGDEWKINVADGGVMTFGNDKNSAGTYVTHMTMTPHATVGSSTVAFAGGVTIASDLTVTGDDITMATNTAGYLLVADGTNFNPVALSGDITTVSGSGSLTIANNAVSLAKMAGLARGKIIYGDSSGDPSALTVGSANTVLQSDGTDATWATVTNAMLAGSIADSKLSTILTADKVSGSAIQIDGSGVSALSGALASTDKFLIDDAGITKYATIDQLDSYITLSDICADEVAAGDTASSFTTTSGTITIDSQASTTTIDGHTGVTVQSSNSGNVTLTSAADVDLNPTTALTINIAGSDDFQFTANTFTALSGSTIAAQALTATTVTASGNVDFNGDLDVDGTTNLDVVDIDGAVNLAATLTLTDAAYFLGSPTHGYRFNSSDDSINAMIITNAGVISTKGANLDGAVVINDTGADADFRVESDTITHALFVQGSDGNVGIGTTPATLFHTYSTAGDATLRHQSTGGAAIIDIVGTRTSDADTGKLRFRNTTNDLAVLRAERSGADNSGLLKIQTANAGSLATAMTINASGNVGIGKTPGSLRLDVLTTVADNLVAAFENSHATGSYGIVVKAGDDSGNYSADFANKSGTSLMRIRGDGNVGIGVTAPTQKLHVTGDAVIDKTNNGYSGLRIHDDSSDDYNSYIDLGRDSGATRLWVRRGGRIQATTPWANDTPTPVVSFGRSGIAFGSDTAAANTLDDYEEGSWTPASPDVTLVSPVGRYVKIGSVVQWGCQFTFPASSSTDPVIINGLPYTVGNTSAARGGGVINYHNAHVDHNGMQPFLNANAVALNLYLGAVARTYVNVSGAVVNMGGTYSVLA